MSALLIRLGLSRLLPVRLSLSGMLTATIPGALIAFSNRCLA